MNWGSVLHFVSLCCGLVSGHADTVHSPPGLDTGTADDLKAHIHSRLWRNQTRPGVQLDLTGAGREGSGLLC